MTGNLQSTSLALPHRDRPWIRYGKDGEGSAGEENASKGGGSASTSGGGGASTSEGLSKADAEALRKELADAKRSNEELNDVWADMQKALKADTDPESRERSVRKLLKKAGYSPKQIEEYLSPGSDDDEAPKGGKGRRTRDEGEGEVSEHLKELSEEALRDSRQARLEVLQDRLEKSMEKTFADSSPLGKLLAAVSEARGEKVGKEFADSIREEVEETATKAMYNRRKTEKKFEAAWVAEEVKKAAEKIEKKYRPVIADINKVGRSPETDAGEVLLKADPVKPPKVGDKLTVGQGKTKMHEYTTDALSRLAVSSGKTKT